VIVQEWAVGSVDAVGASSATMAGGRPLAAYSLPRH